ncbi:hypothetical protein EVAR_50974_1 [Eumeta japonica]|uniref:Uncharacterized protein n=1 Tax=Eumeta variegata TaxID=151549 RepID=A0A4C1XBY5_EUMVA|nr:hypothetical protein EVAR_50974_1 [Eumeta japonica]
MFDVKKERAYRERAYCAILSRPRGPRAGRGLLTTLVINAMTPSVADSLMCSRRHVGIAILDKLVIGALRARGIRGPRPTTVRRELDTAESGYEIHNVAGAFVGRTGRGQPWPVVANQRAQKWASSTGEIPYCHITECVREVAVSAVVFRPVSESFSGEFPLLTIIRLSFRYSILSQEAGNVLVTLIGLQVSVGDVWDGALNASGLNVAVGGCVAIQLTAVALPCLSSLVGGLYGDAEEALYFQASLKNVLSVVGLVKDSQP